MDDNRSDRAEWLKKRATYLGASEFAAVMGVSPWSTPVELWMLKTGQTKPAPVDPVREKMFKRGQRLEPFIVDMAIDKLEGMGVSATLVNRNQRYYDVEKPYLACEIDFEVRLTGVLTINGETVELDNEIVNGDAKSVHGFARRKWGAEETEDIPIEYAAQFMGGLMITPGQRKRCLVAALIGLDDVGIYWLQRDEETIAAMREKLIAFWEDCVLGGVMPDPIVFSDIRKLFPLDNGLGIEATPEIAEKVRQLADVKARIKTWERDEETLAFDIGAFISPNARLTVGGKDIATWRAQEDTRLDSTRLKEEKPEVFTEFLRTKTIRVLRLKQEKK